MTGVIGEMIKKELAMEELQQDLDAELNDLLDKINDDNQRLDANVINVVAHNGLSVDMKEVDALYVIERSALARAVVIRATWEVDHPRSPKDIVVEYCIDPNVFPRLRMEHAQKFLEDVAAGDYYKRDVDMGLVKKRGMSYADDPDGVIYILNNTLGRHASSIISFLEGGENYQANDLSYQNSWGSW